MTKVPSWFYVMAGVALLWNLMGAAAVIMNFMITPEAMASLPQDQQQLYLDTPKWASYASLLAVGAGSLGCLALLFKKALAYPLLLLSLLGLVLQNIGIFVLTDALSVMGSGVAIMQAFVFIVAIGLVLLAKKAIKETWIG